MSSVDQRVVQMQFDNAQFEKAAATSMGTLGKLGQSLKLTSATKGLADVGSAAGKISFGGLTSGIDQVSTKFGALSVIGVTALSNITNKAVNAGITIAKQFTIDPIKDGFTNYETQINAVQTILANTAAEGTKIGDVNKVLAELNTYANQTIYNFSDMTKNIGTFTAAGVDLQTSVNSIKGIANLAAFSGSNADQASTAMYQLSQSIAAGKVQLQDWNSVVNAGLGGKTFQTALENTARASGVSIDSIIKKAGGFRNSLQQGWLTSSILTKTLSQFTGDLSLAQIKAMGYTDAQAKQIFALGQTAVGAATKIKTASQLGQALKEEVGTAYAAIFKTIFGDIGAATDLFTAIHNTAENALTGPIYALNKVLEGWAKLGGRTAAIDGIKAAFQDLAAVVKPVAEGFREIFPAATAKQLYDMTVNFKNFFERIKIGAVASDELRRTFAGIFAAIGIVWDVAKQLGKVLLDLFGVVTKNSGGFLEFTARVGDWVVNLKKAIERGDDLTKFFSKLETALSVPILLIEAFVQYLKELSDRFGNFDASKVTKSLDDVSVKLGPIGQLSDLANKAWALLFSHLGGIAKAIDPIAKKFVDFFQGLGQQIINALGSLNFSTILSIFNTGLFGGLLLLVKKFVDRMKGSGGGSLGGLVDTIKETFEGLTKTLESMQGTLKAATLLEIALAVGILTISVAKLATINAAGLAAASAAITIMFTQLVASLAIFQKFVGTEGFAKLPFMMGSLILLAAAIDILVIAVKQLSTMDWESLRKGLTGLTVILTVLAGDIRLMGNPERMISTGLGLTALSKAIKNLADVVVTLSGLSWTAMAKGLTGVAGTLIALTLFSKYAEADASGAAQGLGIILLATGIKILATAMKSFAGFSWSEIAKGLISMGGGLGAMAGALTLLPPSSLFSAAGILLVAVSLSLIGDAIQKMGNLDAIVIAKGVETLALSLTAIAGALLLLPPTSLLSAAGVFIVAASLGMITDALGKMGADSWTVIAKGLIDLAGALGIIAVGLVLMIGSLPGSFALLVLAGALLVLTPVLQAFGAMSWTAMGKSLLELAGIFTVLGIAGVLLAPVTPVLIALGGAVLLLGLGVVAAGAGLLLFSAALTALAISGAAGTAAMVALVTAMLGLLPLVAKEIGLAIVAFAKTIGESGPAITKALVSVLTAVLSAIGQLTPKIISTFLSLLYQLLQGAASYTPKLTGAAIQIMIGFLNGIAQKMPALISAGVNVLVQFLAGVSKNLPTVIQSAFNLIITFVNSLADAIVKNAPALGQAGVHLAEAIVEGIVKGLASGAGEVAKAAGGLATGALKAAGHLLGIHSPSREFAKIGLYSAQGFAQGMNDNVSTVTNASETMGKSALMAMTKTISNMSSLVSDNIETNPTITPVLDLSGVKQNASQINDLLTPKAMSVAKPYAVAANISAGYAADANGTNQTTSTTPPSTPVTFIQNNSSPKALSAADIYRQTKNQLSVARGVYVFQNGSSG